MLKKKKIILLAMIIGMGLLFTACQEKEHKSAEVSSVEDTESWEMPQEKIKEGDNTETEEEDRQLLAPVSVYSDLEKAINKLTTATDEAVEETEEIIRKNME